MQTKRTERPIIKTKLSEFPTHNLRRPQNPTHGTRRPKKSPQEKNVFDKHLTLDHFQKWNKERLGQSNSSNLRDLAKVNSIAKERLAEAAARTKQLTADKKREQEKIAEDKRYDTIMQDALKALDKDGSVKKQLADKPEFYRVEHTTPGERSHMLYVNAKFTGNWKDLPLP